MDKKSKEIIKTCREKVLKIIDESEGCKCMFLTDDDICDVLDKQELKKKVNEVLR